MKEADMSTKINYQRLSELSPGDTFTLLRDRDTYTLLRVVPAQKQVLHYWCKPRGSFGEVRLYSTNYVIKHPHAPIPDDDSEDNHDEYE